ncbi:cyanophycin synthetase [Polynucleobacter sp. MWH-Spelu-300-X4]|uniref:cyanophycin synthetase n=1 Tax=Polynucleobacter sp. MWH-Spelu-300-X4 TaxID=2689109 RepID=UPI001BFE5AAB|nr:cyanophycin synthetase [Polynucleobacter sp. MWH-Spelu-300-X4]QWD80194.1 cyanophycin synthetase [Polynucleobacter sp. MWH-Spelu-300-X4]
MTKKTIEIIDIKVLRGPSMWTYRPVLEAWVDIGDLEDCPSNTIPGFTERLCAWLPTLIEHRCSYGERGGFIKRLEEGTWPAHILEHVTLELQNLAGMPGGFGKARETNKRGVYKVVVRAWHEKITKTALYHARDLVMAAIEDRPFDVPAAIKEIEDLVDSLYLGPSTGCIVDAARERRIPSNRLSEGNLVQLGYGNKQRRIWTAETDSTSAIGEGISRDKDLTKTLLAACGVPVPEGRMVDSASDAWEAAQDIGVPVVVKPYDGNHARGVFTNLSTQVEIEKAYADALKEGSGVMVERYIPGNEHRLLVVGKKVVAAAKGESAWVKGDGKRSIRDLINEEINTDPRRGDAEILPLSPVLFDTMLELELSRQNLTIDAIPTIGQEVLVQRSGNMAFEVTHLMHPDVAEQVALAARVVGLDIAGVDLVAQDISRPLEEQGAAIVEVNAGPGLIMHLKPAVGEPQPVGAAIVEHLFPDGANGRIPIVGVTGSRGKTMVAQMVTHLMQLTGLKVGLACSKGAFFNQRLQTTGNCANWTSANRILLNRQVEAAVFENDSRTILNEGLAYDRCTVGIVTSLDPNDTVPECAIVEPEHIYNVMRTQVDLVLPSGAAILNADDEAVAKMAELSDGEVIFISKYGQNETTQKHLQQGGKAIFTENEKIVLAHGPDKTVLTNISSIPVLQSSSKAHALENVLAAVGAAWALNIPKDIIVAGLQTYN